MDNENAVMELLYGYFGEWREKPAPLRTAAEAGAGNALVISPCGLTAGNGGNRFGFELTLRFRTDNDGVFIGYAGALAGVKKYIRDNPVSLYAAEHGYDARFAAIEEIKTMTCGSIRPGCMYLTCTFCLTEYGSYGGAGDGGGKILPFIRFVGENTSVTQGRDFTLLGYEGIEAPDCFISSSRTAGGGRQILTSASPDARKITLELRTAGEMLETFISRLAPSKSGKLYVRRGRISRYIGYTVSGADYACLEGGFRVKLTLFCADPFFRAESNPLYTAHSTVPLLTFPFNSLSGRGITASLLRSDMSIGVYNGGHAEAGLKAELTALSDVLNPSVSCGGGRILLGCTLHRGDTAVISTMPGEQGVTLNGSPCFCFSRDSDFFTLPRGQNIIEVGAESGLSSLNAAITVEERYFGI